MRGRASVVNAKGLNLQSFIMYFMSKHTHF